MVLRVLRSGALMAFLVVVTSPTSAHTIHITTVKLRDISRPIRLLPTFSPTSSSPLPTDNVNDASSNTTTIDGTLHPPTTASPVQEYRWSTEEIIAGTLSLLTVITNETSPPLPPSASTFFPRPPFFSRLPPYLIIYTPQSHGHSRISSRLSRPRSGDTVGCCHQQIHRHQWARATRARAFC